MPVLVLDAMGFELILVETVGVGQEEIDVVALAHSTVIVAVPGLGDEVQAIKAGLMEAGDILVINKADREGFEQTRRHLEMLLHLRGGVRGAEDWETPLLTAVAIRGDGAAALLTALGAHRAWLEAHGEFARQGARRSEQQFLRLTRAGALPRLLQGAEDLLQQVRTRQIDPYSAAQALLERRLPKG